VPVPTPARRAISCTGTDRPSVAQEATRLMDAADPGSAFFGFFALVIAEGAANLGLAEALIGASYDLDEAVRRDGVDPMSALGLLLARAQRAGAVRPEVEAADVKALIGGCLARVAGPAGPADQAALDRMVSITRRGLQK
jgi:hypothetical protein